MSILAACASASNVETPDSDSSEQDVTRSAGVKLAASRSPRRRAAEATDAPPVTATKVHARHVGAVLSSAGYGKQLAIPALWALTFSPATGELFSTAGPGDQNHGLFGKLTIAP